MKFVMSLFKFLSDIEFNSNSEIEFEEKCSIIKFSFVKITYSISKKKCFEISKLILLKIIELYSSS